MLHPAGNDVEAPPREQLPVFGGDAWLDQERGRVAGVVGVEPFDRDEADDAGLVGAADVLLDHFEAQLGELCFCAADHLPQRSARR
ncbi:hypothetical protein [Amycolatopsis sp. NPDC004378]